jgi:hypothetical protein
VITSDAAGDPLHATTEQIDRLVREDLDENFEFRLPADYPEGEPVFRGREGLDQLVAMLSESWREWRMEPERFLDAGERERAGALVGRRQSLGPGQLLSAAARERPPQAADV